MKRLILAARLLLLAVLISPALSAQAVPAQVSFTVSPATTAIHWILPTTLHTVHGTFKLTSGAFTLDTATGKASGLITVDATSGESQSNARDSRMHKEIIESQKFPTITFRPTHIDGKFEPAVARTFKVAGVLNVHGEDHPMELTVDVHPQGAGLAMSTKFIIPFVKWGMKDPSVFAFRTDKEVSLEIESVVSVK